MSCLVFVCLGSVMAPILVVAIEPPVSLRSNNKTPLKAKTLPSIKTMPVQNYKCQKREKVVKCNNIEHFSMLFFHFCCAITWTKIKQWASNSQKQEKAAHCNIVCVCIYITTKLLKECGWRLYFWRYLVGNEVRIFLK